MMPKLVLTFVALAALAVTSVVVADSDDDATITVVDEGATPDDIVKVIELPDTASATAASKSASGVETANNTKDKSEETGREFGQQVSEDARNKDISDQIRADAKQQGNSDARNDNAGGNRHGQPH